MRRLGGIAVLVVGGLLAVQPADEARSDASTVARQQPYVVVYRDKAVRAVSPARRTNNLERRHGFDADLRYRSALPGFAARLTERQANELRTDNAVATVTPDRPVHVARVPLAAGDSVPTGVSRISAATPAGVHEPANSAVAVIDTGIDLDHPDLNAVPGVNCTGSGPPEDDHDHGTFMAGIIGARNNGTGVVGVAPGTKLYAVKSLGSNGAGLVSDVICGIDWVTANAAALGIRTANLSLVALGGASGCGGDPLHLAICNSAAAGVTYVVAAGNEYRNVATLPWALPAAYPEVLTVTAMSDADGAPGGTGGPPSCGPDQLDDSFATFSNYAASPVVAAHMVAAPGVCVRSTARNGYTSDSGTSAAAAHVSGVVALCMGIGGAPGPCTNLSTPEVIQQVRADAEANATLANGFNGDPRHPVGLSFGDLVSALDPTIRRAPHATSVAPPPATASDTRVELELLRVRRLKGRRLLVTVRLAEAGTVEARASARLRRRARRSASRTVRFRRVIRTALAHRAVRIRLKLSRRARRSLRRSLRGGRRVRVTVSVLATDTAGNRMLERRQIRIGR